MEIIIALLIVALVGVYANKYMNHRSQKLQQSQPPQQDEATSEDCNQAQTAVAAQNASNDQTKEESIVNQNNKENKIMEERKGARDLFLETLTKIGCQYEIGEGEDGDINFGYQGEYFVVRASNNNRFIHIYDTHWGHVELYDIDEFARLKKAINESNLRNSVTTVYTIDEAGSNVDVHCKSVILFTQEIPEIVDYLRLELSEYFRVHETINMEMAKQRELEVNK
jgi:hypothetical protein